MVVRPTILSAALVLAWSLGAGPATAQPAPPVTTGSPARPPAAAPPAATVPPPAAQPARLTLSPKEVTVVGSSTIRVGRDLYQVSGIRSPRATGGACLFERLRGREARKALVRLMRNGPIVVTPTGTITRRGARLAEVSVRGRSVAQALIAREVALPVRITGRNPWCLGGAPR